MAVLPNGPIVPAQPTEDLVLGDHDGFGHVGELFNRPIEPENTIDRTGDGTRVEPRIVETDSTVAGHTATFVTMS